MKNNLDPYLIELESKIQILEGENEALSAKAEENLLLNRAFEEINTHNDLDNLMLNTLESFSIILNIQFSGIFSYIGNQFICVSSYALFSDEDTTEISFSATEFPHQLLASNGTYHLTKTNNSFTFNYPNIDFTANEVLIIPIDSKILSNRFFVFVNDKNGTELLSRSYFFEKVINIFSVKLERIYYQQKIEKLNEELEQKVELRTIELHNKIQEHIKLNKKHKNTNKKLRLAKEKAEESDRLKSAFLANMSHEIRTPMNGILGFADLLREPNLKGEEQQKYIEIIEKSGRRMLNIINDIIDISKIEAGLMKLHIKETNVNDLIEDVYTFFKPEAESKKLKLSLKKTFATHTAMLKTDCEKVYAILTNLVKNAIKYTDKGSIELGYYTESTNNMAILRFFVKDTGIGISKDRLKAIFERFVQADIADKMARQGAGLGLAITKAYAEMLNGAIEVESTENVGSTFYFTIPYNSQPSAIKHNSKQEPAERKENELKLKILIAEDDEISEILLCETIRIFAKEILIARTGVEAINICRDNPDIDLILMDIRMPEMGGYEATHLIREFNQEVIIIAQTAFSLSGDKQKTLEAGCNNYISKPINKTKLHAMISMYFSK